MFATHLCLVPMLRMSMPSWNRQQKLHLFFFYLWHHLSIFVCLHLFRLQGHFFQGTWKRISYSYQYYHIFVSVPLFWIFLFVCLSSDAIFQTILGVNAGLPVSVAWMNSLVLICSCITPFRAFSSGFNNIAFSDWLATCCRPRHQAHSYNSPWRPLQGSTPWTEHLCWLWAFDCVSNFLCSLHRNEY